LVIRRGFLSNSEYLSGLEKTGGQTVDRSHSAKENPHQKKQALLHFFQAPIDCYFSLQYPDDGFIVPAVFTVSLRQSSHVKGFAPGPHRSFPLIHHQAYQRHLAENIGNSAPEACVMFCIETEGLGNLKQTRQGV
jgi:hypothetical protein